MKVRNTLVRLAASATLAGAAVTGSLATMAPAASAASCGYRLEHMHSMTAKGTTSQETLTKITCGTSYREWEHKVTHSYTGSVSVLDMYKAGTSKPAHYQEWSTTVTTSAKGTVSVRHVYKSS